jgi:type IV secretory pathway VirB10-like protein
MTDDNEIRAENAESDDAHREYPTATRRIVQEDSGDSDAKTGEAAANSEKPPASGGLFQMVWRRIREERGRPKRIELNTRGRNNMDRSKAFLVLATAVVLVAFAFLALFSTSGAEKRAQARRTQSSLGRPESKVQRAGVAGSTVPLLSADQSGVDPGTDQLSPEDILATARRTPAASPKQEPPNGKNSSQYALSNVAPVNDPALDAYRRQNYVYTPPAAAPPSPVPAPVREANDASDGWKKSSLVFISNTPAAAVTNASLGSTSTRQTFVEPKRNSALLPTGSRLAARLQTAISSAVKTPVIAVVEYNYERNGEIVIPAGTKAIGQLSQVNQNGQVGLRFSSLELPDGTSEPIEGTSISLDYGPLKGSVNGQSRAKRVLVRSLTGIGSMAAYVVGGPGYGGLTGPADQSILLRERIASNTGLAGEQEMMSLAFNQNVVVTLPGNTRFYIVLQEPSSAGRQTEPPAVGGRTDIANAGASSLPTAAELRELISLKNELNRMYREVSASRTSAPQEPQH